MSNKRYFIAKLLIQIVVFCLFLSALALGFTSGIEFVEENAGKLLIGLILSFVGALVASIVAGILFRKAYPALARKAWRKKERTELKQAEAEAEAERKQQELNLQAELQRKKQLEEQESLQNFEICEFCNGKLIHKTDENELYTSFVKTDYTLTKTGYNQYNVKENGFNAKYLTGSCKISCPQCGYRIINDFKATDVGGLFGYKREYLSHDIYVDSNSAVSKEQIKQGRLYTNIDKLLYKYIGKLR